MYNSHDILYEAPITPRGASSILFFQIWYTNHTYRASDKGHLSAYYVKRIRRYVQNSDHGNHEDFQFLCTPVTVAHNVHSLKYILSFWCVYSKPVSAKKGVNWPLPISQVAPHDW